MSVAAKNELLFQFDVNFNDLPRWQKRGVGLYWEEYDKVGENPVTGETAVARRRRIKRELDLPMKDEYGEFVKSFLSQSEARGDS
jgi:tRNA(His) 5'-end guanylyltransferase